jgi:hypothetical protein
MSVKIPIFNNHTSTGPYTSNIVPEHESWKSHVLFGIIGSFHPYIIIIFLMYQISQIITGKDCGLNDIVDIIEFFVGYSGSIFIRHLFDNLKN